MKVGDRVTVEIPREKEHQWSAGALAALEGVTGRVTRVSFNRPTQIGPVSPTNPRDEHGNTRFLVEFDETINGWWRAQTPLKAWWFDKDELLQHGNEPGQTDENEP